MPNTLTGRDATDALRERKSQGTNWPGGEGSRERKFQGANWPGSYWPIRSGERIGPEAKRLGTGFGRLTKRVPHFTRGLRQTPSTTPHKRCH